MEFLFGFGIGWGLGIAFTFSLGRFLWPDREDVWEQHSRFQKRVDEEVKRRVNL